MKWPKLIPHMGSGFIGLILLLVTSAVLANQTSRSAWIIDVNGAISPSTSDFIVSNLQASVEERTAHFILRLDTPGGLSVSMRVIIKHILASSIPVVTFVSPKGARAAGSIFLLIASAIRILWEYERGVIFLLGRFYSVKGPGLIITIPIIQRMVGVQLRTIVLDVPTQDVISKDNASVKVNAVIYYRIADPEKSIIKVEDFNQATSQLSQTRLRSVLGKYELDDMLSSRDQVNKAIQEILDQQTDGWGIKVTNVEIKHVDLNESMVRAIAKQAEAERERRAKVIHALGEMEASVKLSEAAGVLSKQPQALQLRYLQTLTEIAGERTNTIVFPLPIDLVSKLQEIQIGNLMDDK